VLLADGTRRLAHVGVNAPAREARWIWESVTGASMAAGYLREIVVSPGVQRVWERALERRIAGEPLAHVLGEAPFRQLTLVSDARALIPRPETEGLIDLVLARVRGGRILDVGTGTGCIALALSSEGRFEQVLASDISDAALRLARSNVERSRQPVGLILGDLATMIGDAGLDALVSNPPYLSEIEYRQLDRSVKHWEPAMALVGGADGLDHTARLLQDGLRVVRPGGWIALELDCSRARAAGHMAANVGWEDVSLMDDLFGRARYLVARRSDDADVG
jgi:release factor glutamine methyltransferase